MNLCGVTDMGRKKITECLNKLVEIRLNSVNHYWSNEVTFDYGVKGECRIDYLQFVPENQLCVDGIEKGVFRGYEVKSCKEDFSSGCGLNFLCEYNYIVMTMWTYKDLMDRNMLDEVPIYTGILIALPKKNKTDKDILKEEFENPSPIPQDPDVNKWKLIPVRKALKTYRKKSLVEMLFCLMRSRH